MRVPAGTELAQLVQVAQAASGCGSQQEPSMHIPFWSRRAASGCGSQREPRLLNLFWSRWAHYFEAEADFRPRLVALGFSPASSLKGG